VRRVMSQEGVEVVEGERCEKGVCVGGSECKEGVAGGGVGV